MNLKKRLITSEFIRKKFNDIFPKHHYLMYILDEIKLYFPSNLNLQFYILKIDDNNDRLFKKNIRVEKQKIASQRDSARFYHF